MRREIVAHKNAKFGPAQDGAAGDVTGVTEAMVPGNGPREMATRGGPA